MKLIFNIPADKIGRIVVAMNGLYEREENYTEIQWAKECIRRFVIKSVARWETSEAQKQAVVARDDSLLTLEE